MPFESKDMQQRLLLTIPQAARSLNISRAMLYSLIARGKGPPVVHLGRAVRISATSLRKWVDETEREQQRSV
jgi:excisionase family DNA binding protein